MRTSEREFVWTREFTNETPPWCLFAMLSLYFTLYTGLVEIDFHAVKVHTAMTPGCCREAIPCLECMQG